MEAILLRVNHHATLLVFNWTKCRSKVSHQLRMIKLLQHHRMINWSRRIFVHACTILFICTFNFVTISIKRQFIPFTLSSTQIAFIILVTFSSFYFHLAYLFFYTTVDIFSEYLWLSKLSDFPSKFRLRQQNQLINRQDCYFLDSKVLFKIECFLDKFVCDVDSILLILFVFGGVIEVVYLYQFLDQILYGSLSMHITIICMYFGLILFLMCDVCDKFNNAVSRPICFFYSFSMKRV